MTATTLTRPQTKTANKKKSAPLRAMANTASASVTTSTRAKATQPVGATKDDPNSIFYVSPGAKLKATPALSPTQITLLVRPRQQHFSENHRVAAQDAGFGEDRRVMRPALVSHDTGETVAYLQWNGFQAAIGELDCIEVHCDPESCAIESGAGGRLFRVLADFANRLDGYITDGLGRELTAEEMSALGKHIDSVLDRREEDAAPKGVQIDARTTRFPGALSFQHVDKITVDGKRHKKVRRAYFPAPKLGYYAGRAEGTHRATELIQFVLKHKERSPGFVNMLREIFESGQWTIEKADRGDGSIAGEFMEVIEQVFRVGCAHVSKGWLTNRAAYFSKQAVEENEHVAACKAEFVARMKAAKAAKKAQVQDGTA